MPKGNNSLSTCRVPWCSGHEESCKQHRSILLFPLTPAKLFTRGSARMAAFLVFVNFWGTVLFAVKGVMGESYPSYADLSQLSEFC